MTEPSGYPQPDPATADVPTQAPVPESAPEMPRNRPGQPNAARKLEIEARRANVAALVLAHVPYRRIAEMHGVAPGTISDDVAIIKKQWRERAHRSFREHVLEQCALLDQLERSWLPRALDHTDTEHARGAALIVHRCMERRAKLLGLDSPQRIEHLGPDGGPIQVSLEERADRLAAEAQAYMKSLAEIDAASPESNGQHPIDV